MVGDIFQPTHLLFVLVVALLVLGPKKLPEVGRQLGSGLRDFRAAINGERTEPEEVEASYEQTPNTSSEHEVAHQPTAEATSDGHEFAHEATTEATSNGHEFAHEATTEATSNGHEFAHESETAASDDTQHGEKPDSGHEFAYETSESAHKRTDPLA